MLCAQRPLSWFDGSGPSERRAMHATLRSVLALAVLLITIEVREPAAQSALPTLTDPNLTVRAVISDLEQPISMAFIGANESAPLRR